MEEYMFSINYKVQTVILFIITAFLTACGAQDEDSQEANLAPDHCQSLEGVERLTEKPILVTLGHSNNIYKYDPNTEEFELFEIENDYTKEIERLNGWRVTANTQGIVRTIDSRLHKGLLYLSAVMPNDILTSLIVSSGTPESTEKILKPYSVRSTFNEFIKNDKFYTFADNPYTLLEIDGCYTYPHEINDPTVVPKEQNNDGTYKKLKSFSNISVLTFEDERYISARFHNKSSTIYYLKHTNNGVIFEDIGSFENSYISFENEFLIVHSEDSYNIDLYKIADGSLVKLSEYSIERLPGYDISYSLLDTYESNLSIKLGYFKRQDNADEEAESYPTYMMILDNEFNLREFTLKNDLRNNPIRTIQSLNTWKITVDTSNNPETYTLENLLHGTSTVGEQLSNNTLDYYEGDDKSLYYWSSDQKRLIKYVSSSTKITSSLQIDLKETDNYRVQPKFSMPIKDEKFIAYGYTYTQSGYDMIADKMHFGVYDLNSNTLTNKITINTGIKDDSFITSTKHIKLNDSLYYFEASSFGAHNIEDERAMFIVDFEKAKINIPDRLKVDTNLLYQLEK